MTAEREHFLLPPSGNRRLKASLDDSSTGLLSPKMTLGRIRQTLLMNTELGLQFLKQKQKQKQKRVFS